MKDIITALKMFVVLTILTGIIYPLFITLVAQTIFSEKANGDPNFIGQRFDQNKYFWPRPSAVDYNPLPSGGSNLSATSKTLKEIVFKRKGALLVADPSMIENQIPSDLLFASGSGLDPHISIAAALFQAERVAKTRGVDKQSIINLINNVTERRQYFILGEPRVNVLILNRLLDNNNSEKGVK